LIKAFQVQDLFSVAVLQKQGQVLDLVERLVHPRSPLQAALLAIVLPSHLATSTFIFDHADETEHSRGLIQTRGRLGRPEQDVVFLGPALEYGNGSHALWQRLLTHVCVKAGESGNHRIYARLEHDSDAVQIFKNVGFSAYAEEAVFCLEPTRFPTKPQDTLGLRKQVVADSWSLQRLYAAVTPRAVQFAEGLAQGQWQLHNRPLDNRGRRYGYVWEREGEILAALHIRSGKAGYGLKLLVHPDVEDQVNALLQAALSLIQPARGGLKKPVYSSLRTYQSELGLVLADYRFQKIATQVVMVKHTTVRAKDVLTRLIAFEAPVEAKPAVPAPFLKADTRHPKPTNGHIAAEKGLS